MNGDDGRCVVPGTLGHSEDGPPTDGSSAGTKGPDVTVVDV